MLQGRRRKDEDEAADLQETGWHCLFMHSGISGGKYRTWKTGVGNLRYGICALHGRAAVGVRGV